MIRGLDEAYDLDYYQSLINGRVLPADSDQEVIFSVTRDAGEAPELVAALRKEIRAGRLDVELCYCSVYEECWTANLQDIMERLRGTEAPRGSREVDGCDEMAVSGI